MKVSIALIVALWLAACGPGPEQLRAEKFAKLEALRRETQADLIRHTAECQAVAVEFNGDQQMVGNCLETHRVMVDMAQSTNAMIDKRLAEIEATMR